MRYVLSFILLAFLIVGCKKQQIIFHPGEIYLTQENNVSVVLKDGTLENKPEGMYFVVKVLEQRGDKLFLCQYGKRYVEQPQNIELNEFKDCPSYVPIALQNEEFYAPRGYKGRHIYTKRYDNFIESEPQLLTQRPVTDEERQLIADYKPREF